MKQISRKNIYEDELVILNLIQRWCRLKFGWSNRWSCEFRWIRCCCGEWYECFDCVFFSLTVFYQSSNSNFSFKSFSYFASPKSMISLSKRLSQKTKKLHKLPNGRCRYLLIILFSGSTFIFSLSSFFPVNWSSSFLILKAISQCLFSSSLSVFRKRPVMHHFDLKSTCYVWITLTLFVKLDLIFLPLFLHEDFLLIGIIFFNIKELWIQTIISGTLEKTKFE